MCKTTYIKKRREYKSANFFFARSSKPRDFALIVGQAKFNVQ